MGPVASGGGGEALHGAYSDSERGLPDGPAIHWILLRAAAAVPSTHGSALGCRWAPVASGDVASTDRPSELVLKLG